MVADPNEVTTAEIAQAVGVSRQTILSWGDKDCLPKRYTQFRGSYGRSSRWPAFTISLALYVRAALRRSSFAEIARAVKPILDADVDWVNRQIGAGRTIEQLMNDPETVKHRQDDNS